MRLILFYDPSFPYAGPVLQEDARKKLGELFTIVDAASLGDALAQEDVECFVHLHGPYFPKSSWPAILSYLRQGKGFLHAGGRPFRIPVKSEGGEWIAEREQTAYHRQVHIHEALPVRSSRIERVQHNTDIPLASGYEYLFEIQDTYGFVLHATPNKDNPHELGSGGSMDLHIHPILKGVAADGRETAAPVVLIEHMKGEYAGGRWIFINQSLTESFWPEGGQLLADWGQYCRYGVTELWLKPNYASYETPERPMLTLQYQSLHDRSSGVRWDVEIEVRHEGNRVYRQAFAITVQRSLGNWRRVLPIAIKPGVYEVIGKLTSSQGEVRWLRQGFWGMDQQLLASGERLACGRDTFIKGGRTWPIVGMTYMGSDVARKFWFLPNVGLWERDMGKLKRAGVNLIRTGIWTAWRHMAFVDGHVAEDVLRAIDAFILTARRHELEVTFTFFSFTPETWEGENPYLDPRSLAAQKRFIAAIVSRHKDTTNVHWDLINEPSMFDPQRPFAGPRSSHDRHEHAAYIHWLQERHGKIEILQERWNMTPEQLPDFTAVVLPEQEEINFSVQDMTHDKRGLVWLDYCLFSMEMHNRWARELASAIYEIQPAQLITVGQDEALPSQRPSPFFYAEAVDYTSVHTWWQMDDLVWDGVFTKDPQKPNLVQETGIMYVENADGRARRSEEELRNILERKYAYAFATGAAGAVQWIWNTNIYMDNINESNIGALRADGTEKPEADVTYQFGAFMQRIGEAMTDRQLEEIAVVYPYSNDFSNRSMAEEATKRLTRSLAYDLKMPFRGIGEYQLERSADQPAELYIIPSAHNLTYKALNDLLENIKHTGGTLLVTGPISLDEYWGKTKRVAELVGCTEIKNVLREELLDIEGVIYPVSFTGQRIADAMKELPEDHPTGKPVKLSHAEVGLGSLIWCPLPIELNERTDVLSAVYRYAMRVAGIANELVWIEGGSLPGIYGRKLTYANGSLYVFVSECGSNVNVAVRDERTGTTYRFELPQERSVLFFTADDGSIRAVCRPEEVNVLAD